MGLTFWLEIVTLAKGRSCQHCEGWKHSPYAISINPLSGNRRFDMAESAQLLTVMHAWYWMLRLKSVAQAPFRSRFLKIETTRFHADLTWRKLEAYSFVDIAVDARAFATTKPVTCFQNPGDVSNNLAIQSCKWINFQTHLWLCPFLNLTGGKVAPIALG